MIIFIIFYLIGCVITYFVVKFLQKRGLGIHDFEEWEDISLRIILGLFSWLGFFMVVIPIILIVIIDNLPNKPPKWL